MISGTKLCKMDTKKNKTETLYSRNLKVNSKKRARFCNRNIYRAPYGDLRERSTDIIWDGSGWMIKRN